MCGEGTKQKTETISLRYNSVEPQPSFYEQIYAIRASEH